MRGKMFWDWMSWRQLCFSSQTERHQRQSTDADWSPLTTTQTIIVFFFFFAVGFLFLSFTAEKFLSGAELSHCEHRPSLNCSQRELSPAPAQNTNTTSRYALSADSHGNISFFRLSRNRHKCIYYSSSTDTWGSELLEAVMEWWQRRQWW